MSWYWYPLIVIGACALSGFVGVFTGMCMHETGADDRDDSQPAGLWSGHERRKIKPYE